MPVLVFLWPCFGVEFRLDAAPPPQAGARVEVEVWRGGQAWHFASDPLVTPAHGTDADRRLAKWLVEQLGTSDHNDLPKDPADIGKWLIDRLDSLSVDPEVRPVPPSKLASPGRMGWDVVCNKPLPEGLPRLAVFVETTALPKGLTLGPTLSEAIQLAGDPETERIRKAASPNCVRMLANTAISLCGTDASPAKQMPTAETLQQLMLAASRLTLIAAERYALTRDNVEFNPAVEEGMKAFVQQRFEGRPIEIYFKTVDGRKEVRLRNFDPIHRVALMFDEIVLPEEQGGVLKPREFGQRYRGTPIGRVIGRKIAIATKALRRELARSGTTARLPCFLSEKEKAELMRRFADFKGVIPVMHQTRDGVVTYHLRYRPSSGALGVSFQADSVRELSGSAGFEQAWTFRNNDVLSANMSAGLQSTNGLAAYTVPLGAIAPHPLQFEASLSASYDRHHGVRLGTDTGPLVDTTKAEAGLGIAANFFKGRGILDSEGQNADNEIHARASLVVGVGRLKGTGEPSFLGRTKEVSGPSVTVRLEFLSLRRGAGPASEGQGGLFSFGGSLQGTAALVTDARDYTTVEANLYARQEFAGASSTQYYVEARLTGGYKTSGAPRIDFYRLGDGVISGMDEGEIAGRSYTTASIEAGPNLGHLLRRLSDQLAPAKKPGKPAKSKGSPSLLDSVYGFLLAEYGAVARQRNAGDRFNPNQRASSLAIGARYFGTVAGVNNRSQSASFGYAWSPQSIRKSGRFFIRLSLSFD